VAVLRPPVALLKRVNAPSAVFPKPVVLLKSAPAPVAVFSPAVLARSVPAPRPVQKLAVVRAGSAAQESVLPFCGVASGIAAIRRWHDGLCFRRKLKAGQEQPNCNERYISFDNCFHKTFFRLLMFHCDFSKRPRSRNGSRRFTRGGLDGWGLWIAADAAQGAVWVSTTNNQCLPA